MKNLTWQNPEQLFVAQELINKVKSKCCGIKVNNTVKYFKENNSFTLEDFSKQVIGDQKIIDSFNKYKESYEQKREISIEDNFEISENAVNKQVKGLKSVVKLDENFHIYIHGDNQMIKRGYDNASGLYYYQLFFKEEK